MFVRLLVCACALSLFNSSLAIAAPINTYAVFAGGNLTTNSQVQSNGAAGANGNVTMNFQNSFPSVSGGGFFNNNSSNLSVPGSIIFNGNVQIGFNGNVGGPIHSGGVVSGGGQITAGNVFQANAAPINLGFGSTAVSLNSGAIPPTLQSFSPVLIPTASTHTPGGSNQSAAYQGILTLGPGDYGSLTTNTQAVVNLSSGIYDFDSINLGFDTTVNIDLTGGAITLIVGGAFNLNTQIDWVLTGGTAADVYLEIHSNTALPYAFNFPGTIFLPNSNVSTNSDTVINGALWAGGNVDLGYNTRINYVASNSLPPQFLPPDDGGGSEEVPEPASLVLWGTAMLAGFAIRRRKVARKIM